MAAEKACLKQLMTSFRLLNQQDKTKNILVLAHKLQEKDP
jgi:hypothetical protein